MITNGTVSVRLLHHHRRVRSRHAQDHDFAGALPRRVWLDEERGVLVDVPEDLVASAHVRGAPEEPCVPMRCDVELGDRDSCDEASDPACESVDMTAGSHCRKSAVAGALHAA